ncbi:hypothetical protein NPIL_52411 [Nephila pilipes]|uniref:Uncharacterized protein n=1 Tax=Nephila pilipes TaxID=299642 RepID=A0A8X6QD08_NEPPI|nr:hypothetical protein NPIL_558511 [Nephila pilipes]GFU21066.1 hypothetical protein NPIL_52411 [Nephila pilipes]
MYDEVESSDEKVSSSQNTKICRGDSGDQLKWFNLFSYKAKFLLNIKKTKRSAKSFFEHAELTIASRTLKSKNRDIE